MIKRLVIFIFYLSTTIVEVAEASLLFNPRYDLVANENIHVNRLIVSSQADFQVKSFRFYTDFFAEHNFNDPEFYEWRSVRSKGFLQEFYVEYSTSSLFLKIGRQANRWSDSWIIPSLDVWTARKYDRLFIDPLSFQLTHSGGASLSVSREHWQLDLVAFTEVAEDTFPAIITQPQSQKEDINPGVRFKFDFKGLQNSFVAARALKKNTFGYGLNYAFENWVPKIEIGYRDNQQNSLFIYRKESSFASIGTDIFIGQLTMTPQFVLYTEDSNPEDITQGVHYFSLLYNAGKNEIQLQEFGNTYYKDYFYSAQYTRTFKKKFSIGILYQNYNGGLGTLNWLVQDRVKGDLYGVRFQFFSDI
ncbi:MAG: hypothetical protein HUU56_13590 [Bdellovibrionaceae bacterium]|nr:hypothetical protein [Pseudobdellovibrionaceae bacterium]